MNSSWGSKTVDPMIVVLQSLDMIHTAVGPAERLNIPFASRKVFCKGNTRFSKCYMSYHEKAHGSILLLSLTRGGRASRLTWKLTAPAICGEQDF